MKMARRAAKRDQSEAPIVEALEAAGWQVWRELPVDLLCYKPEKGFRVLEVKTPDDKGRTPKPRADRQAQNEFIAATGAPRVCTPEEALRALGTVLL